VAKGSGPRLKLKDIPELPILRQLQKAWDDCTPDRIFPSRSGERYPDWCLLKIWGMPRSEWGNYTYGDGEIWLRNPDLNLHHAFGDNYGLHIPYKMKIRKMEALERRGLVVDINGESYQITDKGREYLAHIESMDAGIAIVKGWSKNNGNEEVAQG
jgi:hypothetical protein